MDHSMVNVRDFGAVGDGAADDRAAIQAALDSGDSDVLVPPGDYLVGKGSGAWCLLVPAGVTLHSWPSTLPAVLRQAPAIGANVRLLQIAAPNVAIKDITLDGDRAMQTPDEHRSGVFATGAPNLTLQRVVAKNFTGDGFYIHIGSNDPLIDECIAYDNTRNGITFGGGTTGGYVTGGDYTGNGAQQIDSEGGAVADLTIKGVTLNVGAGNDFALTISGASQIARSHSWLVEDCDIAGGINVVWADDITIRNCHGVNPTTKASCTVYRRCDRVRIEGCDWTMTQTSVNSLGVVTLTGTGTMSAPSHVLVTRCRLRSIGKAQAFGVRVDGALSVEISDNEIHGPALPAAGYAGVYLRATNAIEDFKSAVVRRNRVSNWGACGVIVTGNGAARLRLLDISDNIFDDNGEAMTKALYLDDGTGAARDVRQRGNLALGGCTMLMGRAPAGVVSPWGDGDRWVTP
jgi:hypothetical protein